MRFIITLILCIPLAYAPIIQGAESALSIKAGERSHNGNSYSWKADSVSISEPSIQSYASTVKAPGAFKEEFLKRDRWPNWNKGFKPIALLPDTRSADGTLMLGLMYKTIIPDSVQISSIEGKTFENGVDFKVNPMWGQASSVGNTLGIEAKTKIKVSFNYRMQRLDLVQVNKDGKISVKTGVESILCPAFPEADPEHCPIAGIYVHPFLPQEGEDYSINDEHVFSINPASEQPVINKQCISKSKELLKSSKPIKIALLGDSVTLGAEAGFWWDDRSKTYTSRFIAGLQKQYAGAQITEIPAYKGGITTEAGAQFFKKDVAPAKPDLLVIALGLNDASGPANRPKVTAPVFKAAILKMVQAAKASDSEVILVTPFRGNPFIAAGKRIGDYRQALIEIANEEQVACADVLTAWDGLAQRGIAPYSQLHNWINHPGAFGHSVYSDCILGLFK